jgi:hypothetical protein
MRGEEPYAGAAVSNSWQSGVAERLLGGRIELKAVDRLMHLGPLGLGGLRPATGGGR